MIRLMTALGALALATPAIAQQTPPASPEPTPAPNATPAPAPPPPSADDIARAVAADWAKYDQGGKGHLTQAEFSTWLSALRASSNGAAAEDPAKVKAWADAAFPEADKNADAKVTPEEWTGFLQSKTRR